VNKGLTKNAGHYFLAINDRLSDHLSLVMMVGIYAIIQLKRFNTVTQHFLKVDNRHLEYDKKLEDLILSQHRFLKKYMITKDQRFYDQFLSTKEAFFSMDSSFPRILFSSF
jgi:hypothetical protein